MKSLCAAVALSGTRVGLAGHAIQRRLCHYGLHQGRAFTPSPGGMNSKTGDSAMLVSYVRGAFCPGKRFSDASAFGFIFEIMKSYFLMCLFFCARLTL